LTRSFNFLEDLPDPLLGIPVRCFQKDLGATTSEEFIELITLFILLLVED